MLADVQEPAIVAMRLRASAETRRAQAAFDMTRVLGQVGIGAEPCKHGRAAATT